MEVALTSVHLALRAQVEACSQQEQKPVHLYKKHTRMIRSDLTKITNTFNGGGDPQSNRLHYYGSQHIVSIDGAGINKQTACWKLKTWKVQTWSRTRTSSPLMFCIISLMQLNSPHRYHQSFLSAQGQRVIWRQEFVLLGLLSPNSSSSSSSSSSSQFLPTVPVEQLLDEQGSRKSQRGWKVPADGEISSLFKMRYL